MTGPQLKQWRTSEGISGHELVQQYLGGAISQATLSRWESNNANIPDWVTEKLLGQTRVTLPLNELHTALDYARAHGIEFGELLARAIRQMFDRETQLDKPSAPSASPREPSAVPTPAHKAAASGRLNETPPAYRTKEPDVEIVIDPSADQMRVAAQADAIRAQRARKPRA